MSLGDTCGARDAKLAVLLFLVGRKKLSSISTMELLGSSRLIMDMLRCCVEWLEPMEFKDSERCFFCCGGITFSFKTCGLVDPLSASDELMGLFLSEGRFMADSGSGHSTGIDKSHVGVTKGQKEQLKWAKRDKGANLDKLESHSGGSWCGSRSFFLHNLVAQSPALSVLR